MTRQAQGDQDSVVCPHCQKQATVQAYGESQPPAFVHPSSIFQENETNQHMMRVLLSCGCTIEQPDDHLREIVQRKRQEQVTGIHTAPGSPFHAGALSVTEPLARSTTVKINTTSKKKDIR